MTNTTVSLNVPEVLHHNSFSRTTLSACKERYVRHVLCLTWEVIKGFIYDCIIKCTRNLMLTGFCIREYRIFKELYGTIMRTDPDLKRFKTLCTM
jgi:hypothetical protein